MLSVTAAVLYFAVAKAENIANQWSENSLVITNEITMNESLIKTSLGDIIIKLLEDKAPRTVANFVKLSEEKFYNDTKFHRVIPNFMIQGGDPLTKDDTAKGRWGTGGPGYRFADEPNDVEMVRGIVAMANSGPDTNGSQFFIITASATPWLQGKHTAFGKVISGMDIVDKISAVARDSNDAPITPIVVKKVTTK